MYEYQAKIERVIDGDTVVATVDLGFSTFRQETFRLYGINAPEIHSKDAAEKAAGLKTKARLEEMIAYGGTTPVTIKTKKDDQEKYGRYLAEIEVTRKDGSVVNCNKALVAESLAKEYFGGKR